MRIVDGQRSIVHSLGRLLILNTIITALVVIIDLQLVEIDDFTRQTLLFTVVKVKIAYQ